MDYFHLEQMDRGWFVGAFLPTALHTANAEVGVKRYAAGAYEARHHHKIATEVTAIISGQAEMSGRVLTEGEIVVIPPGESTDFRALTDVVTVVVKVPAAANDKYDG